MKSPHFLRITRVLVAFGAFLLAGTGAQAGGNHATTSVEQLLLVEINRVRVAQGLPPLRADTRLQLAARAHSRALLRRGSLTHGSFGRRLQSYGVRSPLIGENLAWMVGPRPRVRWIVEQWLRSPGHRANLLRAGFHRVGVGGAVGPFQGHPKAHVLTADFAA